MWNRLDRSKRLLTCIFASGLIYYLTYLSTYQLTEYFEFTHSTSWIYLPSGIRLMLVLVLTGSGAFGVALGTLAIEYLIIHSGDHVYNLFTSLVAGGSAYLGMVVSQRLFQLKCDLHELTARQLLGICVVFAIVCPLSHQLWFCLYGHTRDFWPSFLVMSIGDFGGCIVVLAVIQFTLKVFRSGQTP